MKKLVTTLLGQSFLCFCNVVQKSMLSGTELKGDKFFINIKFRLMNDYTDILRQPDLIPFGLHELKEQNKDISDLPNIIQNLKDLY